MIWVTTILSPSPLSCAKLSIICWYHRLFSSDESMKKIIKITGLLSLAWWIAITATVAFSCIPLRAIPQVQQGSGHCIINKGLYLAYEVPNCILDFWILAMPALKIEKMQLPLGWKMVLYFFPVLAVLYVVFSQFRFLFFFTDLLLKKMMRVVLGLSISLWWLSLRAVSHLQNKNPPFDCKITDCCSLY